MARARKNPIPITVVAGPRGAGKTTLINRLLATRAFANTAVILNDFGEVALAGSIVETAEDGYIALGSGCVCCSVRGALTDSLEKLLRDLDNGRVAAIGRVVIEVDEMADPAGIFGAVLRHPYLSLRYAPDGIVAVIDGASSFAARPNTVRQVAMADVVAVRGDSTEAAHINRRIADACEVTADDVTGFGPFDAEIGDIDAWLAVPSGALAFSVTRERQIPLPALERFLDHLGALQGPNLIRVRGAVATSPEDTVIVEGVGVYFYPPLIVERATGVTRFAVVAQSFDRATFEGYLDAFLNEPRVDTPDRAALTANPLAIAGFSARSGR
ncbi:MAG TPA: GTP-binding protein [Bauldia sp.]|nr:GTP-binding protein [Bauldia sp.]